MTLFLLITNILGGLVAVQLFRGDVGADNNMNFGETYAAFLAMYQVRDDCFASAITLIRVTSRSFRRKTGLTSFTSLSMLRRPFNSC